MANNVVEPKDNEVVNDDLHSGLSHLPEADKAEIIALRREAAEKRVKAKEVQAELDKLRNEQKERDDLKMKEDGKLKELLESKEKELSDLKSLKEENDRHKEFFTSQLEAAIKKLSKTQGVLIAESEMPLSKKLEWALKLGSEKLGLVDSPDSRRPGGDVPIPEIDLDEYMGPEGRKKLLALRDTNKALYDKILELKNIT